MWLLVKHYYLGNKFKNVSTVFCFILNINNNNNVALWQLNIFFLGLIAFKKPYIKSANCKGTFKKDKNKAMRKLTWMCLNQ